MTVAIQFNNVVFPEPLAPIIPKYSPFRTSKVIPFSAQVDGTVDLNASDKPPINRRETADKVPVNEQEQQIYKYVLENAGITTAQAMKLLGIKQRRAREILVKMVENGWLRREGASRSTIYVKNTEGR